MRDRKERLTLFAGLLVVLGYCWRVRPPGFIRGYLPDMCMLEITRQLISEQMGAHGRPTFHTESLMSPFGISVAYLPGSIEASGIGALFWKWNPDFPYLWCYFVVSILVSYLGVGVLCRRLGMPGVAAWTLAALVTVYNPARHFKAWHHGELLFLHWVYLSVFLDAVIWRSFVEERRLSWSLELWRAWMLVAMLGGTGYFWGPLILEWVVVRAWMLWTYRFGGRSFTLEGSRRSAAAAVSLSVAWTGLHLWWFLPLFEQVRQLGIAGGEIGGFAEPQMLVRPLWLDDLWSLIRPWSGSDAEVVPFDAPETVVTMGWVLWGPALLALWQLRRRSGGPGFSTAAPFVSLTVIAVLYISVRPPIFQEVLRTVVPFMGFFRVASRWGLILPALLGVLIALGWQGSSAWVRKNGSSGGFRAALGIFAILSVIEIRHLGAAVNAMAPMRKPLEKLLQGVKAAPGTTVLDLPFCVIGANGTCGNEQCVHYPYSIAGQGFRTLHGKAVYGSYLSRMIPAQCEIYDRPPYTSWFAAWSEDRCWTPIEWAGFCSYLDEHPELSAVLLYPDFWTATDRPECWSEYEARLGEPKKMARFATGPVRGGQRPVMARVAWFAPRCQTR